MEENKKYKVVVSDRAKRMLGTHIRFLAQASTETAAAKKKNLISFIDSRIFFKASLGNCM